MALGTSRATWETISFHELHPLPVLSLACPVSVPPNPPTLVAQAQSVFSFIVGVYRPQCWWWEAMVTLRKLLLVLVLVFVPGQRLRAYLGLLVIGAAFVIHVLAWPFVEPKYNKMEWISLLSAILTLLCGLIVLEVPGGLGRGLCGCPSVLP